MARLEYLHYLIPLVFECADDLYLLVPVLRIVSRFLLRLRDVGQYAGKSSLVEAKLIALDCSDCFDGRLCTYDFC